MAETFEDVNTLKEFSETYPRASWSPMIYNKFQKVYNIYLHIDLNSIEGCGISVTAAKADAIRKHTAIISSKKMSNLYNRINDPENMIKNCAPSNNLGNTSHLAEDTQTSDCTKNSESTLPSTETLDHTIQHFKNDRFRIFRDFEKAYQFLCHWSLAELESSDNDSLKTVLNIGDYQFEGCGCTLYEAKINAIMKFYLSSVDDFFAISNQKNETETLLGNKPSNDQGNSSHCADTEPSDCCDNLVPIKISEEPNISPCLQNRPDKNNTAPNSFLEIYNLRNSIWSPFCQIAKQSTFKKYFKVVLRMGNKIFHGQGVKKCNAQLNAIKKFKNSILHKQKKFKNTTFIDNLNIIGKRSLQSPAIKSLIFDNKFNGKYYS